MWFSKGNEMQYVMKRSLISRTKTITALLILHEFNILEHVNIFRF